MSLGQTTTDKGRVYMFSYNSGSDLWELEDYLQNPSNLGLNHTNKRYLQPFGTQAVWHELGSGGYPASILDFSATTIGVIKHLAETNIYFRCSTGSSGTVETIACRKETPTNAFSIYHSTDNFTTPETVTAISRAYGDHGYSIRSKRTWRKLLLNSSKM